jgi:FAD/FMN-containing dehydrogenase
MSTLQAPTGFAGRLLQPGDDGYDQARSIFNGMIDRRPALVASCTCAGDVAVALTIAREQGLEVTVRGGGHAPSGSAVADGALMIDCTPMKTIEVDPEARTVRAGAGVVWGELDAATQEHGLAVTGGRVSKTGIAGLTLGSGSGWIERSFGLTVDSLLSCRVVTADGREVRAAADENPDLFFALRGGGGNFGVATEFEYRLRPLGPLVAGGLILHPFEAAEDALRAYRDFMATAPDEVGGGAVLMHAPPAPFVAPDLVGKPVAGFVLVHTGSVEEGLEALAPLRAIGEPLVDIVGPMPYVALQQMLDEGNPWGAHCYFKAAFMPDLTDGTIHDAVQLLPAAPSPMSALVLQPLGGAFSRVDDDETALGHRSTTRWIWHSLNVWMDPAADAANLEYARLVAAALAPHSMTAAHPNYVDDVVRVRGFYSDRTWERLVAAKRKWDPDNVFHHNHNIPPGG